MARLMETVLMAAEAPALACERLSHHLRFGDENSTGYTFHSKGTDDEHTVSSFALFSPQRDEESVCRRRGGSGVQCLTVSGFVIFTLRFDFPQLELRKKRQKIKIKHMH